MNWLGIVLGNPLILLAAALLLNGAASAWAFRRRSVDAGGAAAGALVGTLIFVSGGPFFWLVLMAFFLSSTALGRFGGNKREQAEAIHEKSGRRDFVQVVANGGIGMISAVLFRLTGDPAWAVGFAVSFAVASADTWGSEAGILSRGDPVSLLTLRPVPRGISGGVSVLGLAASLGGALFIAVIFAAENLAVARTPTGFAALAVYVAACGFIGSIVDSLLGATLQAQYAVETGSAILITERPSTNGVRNRLVRGLALVNNDVVNLASCALVTAAAVLLYPLIA